MTTPLELCLLPLNEDTMGEITDLQSPRAMTQAHAVKNEAARELRKTKRLLLQLGDFRSVDLDEYKALRLAFDKLYSKLDELSIQ